jgi:acetyl-CoA acyltransferase
VARLKENIMRDAVIIDAVRTPIGKGKPGGSLSAVHPVDLLAHTLRALTDRTGLDPALVDDVIGGCVDQVGEQAVNTTRWAVLAAGFPESVPATTVDRQCGSSQQAVHFAAQGIMAGAYDIVIACGIESMSRVPMWSNVPPGADPFGPGVARRYPEGLVPQGISAELIAAKWNLSRAELDDFSAISHQRAAAAQAAGLFGGELAPVTVTDGEGASRLVYRDEGVRPATTAEVLSGLRPAFYDESFARRYPEIGWRVTAGNSSQINDGAAALLLMSGERAAALGLTPMARVRSFAVAADDPVMMLTAVIPATGKVLQAAGLSLGDIDLFEVNEAFASVVLAWQRETGADLDKVNVHGGAIALGHPLGASGARIMTTLVHAMRARGARLGLQTMCEAGGLANATIIERL